MPRSRVWSWRLWALERESTVLLMVVVTAQRAMFQQKDQNPKSFRSSTYAAGCL